LKREINSVKPLTVQNHPLVTTSIVLDFISQVRKSYYQWTIQP